MMRTLLVIAGIAAGLFLIDRAALAMERRGWIYWCKRKANPGPRAAAALEIRLVLERGARCVEEEQAEREDGDDELGGRSSRALISPVP